ncbi:4-(cytidine 5'-diphospho)-2-C-methyl-D-erythritol kinase [Nitrospira sp. BLG_1]|uniref:4-(cytidine 5'-diphospho)-2-C-methyl-D-erythritol kinase n=1 Tax=Nitrospira sp. BLG_1 TaxID=3395883 RepID=UPI0039BCA7EC
MTNLSPASTSRPLSIRVFAPAKINLVLRILDRRTDGYHNLWSLMQTVQVEDEITLELTGAHSGVTLRCDEPSLKTDGSNLVSRAAVAVMEQSGQTGGLDITLAKRIPMGAGLGGGSSDAAATIIGLNQLFNLGWSVEQMAHIGQTLGSDVAFFFFAPSATVAGRGEQVASIRIKGTRWVVLVNPGFPVETKWAYQQLTANRAGVVPLSQSHAMLEQASELGWEQVLEAAENDFEGPVFKAYPLLQEIKHRLLALEADVALLSGSGATVFGVFRDEAKARQAQALFMNEPQFKVFVAQTSSPS